VGVERRAGHKNAPLGRKDIVGVETVKTNETGDSCKGLGPGASENEAIDEASIRQIFQVGRCEVKKKGDGPVY
jgi:hypothetical protein